MDYKRGYGAAELGSGPSPILWNQIPRLEIEADPARGFGFMEQFPYSCIGTANGGSLGVWELAHYTGGAWSRADMVGGGIKLVPPNSTAQGVQMQMQEIFKPTAGQKIVFETSFAMVIANDANIFLGLHLHDTDIPGSFGNEAIGFRMVDGTSARLDYQIRKGGVGDAATTGKTLANNTYTRVGFVIEGTSKARFYVDGEVKIVSESALINLATEVAPSLVCRAGNGGVQNGMTIPWVYCYQFDWAGVSTDSAT